MQRIRQSIKEAQDWKKSYFDAHRVDRIYEVGNRVFLQVKPHKSSIKFGKGDKISPGFMGPFDIVEKKWLVAYRLALPDSLRRMHDIFHIYFLTHYISDPTHFIDMISFQVSNAIDSNLWDFQPLGIDSPISSKCPISEVMDMMPRVQTTDS
jgi:hypothetical protein